MQEITIQVSEEMLERLRESARRMNISVDLLVQQALDRQIGSKRSIDAPDAPPPGTFAALAEAVKASPPIIAERTDIAENFRTVLDQEWGTHLTRWMEEEDQPSDE